MKAVRLYEYGPSKNLKYETDVPDPELGEDDVLIAAAASSINPIDWKMRSGAAQARAPLSFPAILGRDVSGLVRAVGSNVRNVKVGERVMALTRGAYAELVLVKGSEVTHIPDGVDILNAAALPLIALTGDQLVRNACELKEGQSIFITGPLGSVGRAAVHTAKKIGAHIILGVRKTQIDEARQLGANAVVAIDDDEALKQMGKVDCMADIIGGDAATKLLQYIKPGGICGTVVTPQPNAALHPDIRVQHFMAKSDPSKVREFADDYRDGKFILPIANTYALSDIVEATDHAEKGGAGGKILLLIL